MDRESSPGVKMTARLAGGSVEDEGLEEEGQGGVAKLTICPKSAVWSKFPCCVPTRGCHMHLITVLHCQNRAMGAEAELVPFTRGPPLVTS